MGLTTGNGSVTSFGKQLRRIVIRCIAVLTTVTVAGALAACGSAQGAVGLPKDALPEGSTRTITFGITPGPYGDMITDVIAPLIRKDGYVLETKEFNDYVQPNKALAAGQIDANLFQHTPYLTKFAKENNLDLTSLGYVPTLGMGLYSKRYKTLEELPQGATISIASDASNTSRSLTALAQKNLITVKDGIDPTKATLNDISSNPKDLKFKSIDAAQVARSLDTVDAGLVNGGFALSAGLDPKNALLLEEPTKDVVNVVAVRTSDKDSDFAVKLSALLVSQEFKDAIKASPVFSQFAEPPSWK